MSLNTTLKNTPNFPDSNFLYPINTGSNFDKLNNKENHYNNLIKLITESPYHKEIIKQCEIEVNGINIENSTPKILKSIVIKYIKEDLNTGKPGNKNINKAFEAHSAAKHAPGF